MRASQALEHTQQFLTRHRKRLIVAASVYLVYLVFGFLIAPMIVKGQLEQALSAATGQHATVAEVKVNPLTLSVRVLDLKVAEADGSPLLGVADLYVNVQSSSLFRAALVFGEIAITGPWVNAVVEPDATLNLSRIGAPPVGGAEAATDTPATAADEEPPPVMVQRFTLTGGLIGYEDRSLAAPVRREFRIVDLGANDLSTRRGESGTYKLDATGDRARFRWEGQVGFNPIASSGQVEFSGINLPLMQENFLAGRLAGQIRNGRLDVVTDYAVARRADGEFDLKLSDGRITLSDFVLAASADSATTALELPKVELTGTTLDLRGQSVRLGRIAITDPVVRATLAADGLDLVALLAPPSAAPAPAVAPAVEPAAPAGPPWRVALGELALTGGRVEINDTTPPASVLHTIAPLAVTLRDATLAPAFRTTLELSAGINGGTLKLSGPVATAPMAATLALNVQALGLAPYGPYLASVGAFELTRGAVEAEGNLTLAGEQIAYSGYLGSTDLALRDRALKQDFLRYKRLQLRGVEAKVPPAPQALSLAIKEVVLEQPYLRMIIGPDRVTNIDHILGTERPPASTDDAAAAPAPAPAPAPAKPVPAAPAPKVKVASVRIVDGSANFADLSLQPAFSTAIGELNGTIKGLSSAEKTQAEVSIDGRVDRYAPVTVRGTLNPLAAKPTTDLAVKFKDIELTTFTPYSGKFMGMKIEQGRLSLDLHYKLVDRMLEGENKIVLDQFTLGENVDSPDAMGLPVRLAIALLKDSRGVIDLDLPVNGSLDDPQFSYGKIMWKAFVSLITKAVTAPFAALGNLFGGGPDLEKVAFAPGSTVPDASGQAQLDTIAKGLAAKLELRLDVPGATDVKLDGDMFARRKVLARVRPDGSAPDAGTLTPKELRALADQFTAKFPGVDPATVLPPTAEGKKPEPAALAAEQLTRLAAAEPADPAALADLARARGLAIKDYMVTRGGLPPERIYLKDVNAVATAKDGQVVVTLELSAP